MNNENLKRKVRETAYEILKNQVFIGPVDLLMGMDVYHVRIMRTGDWGKYRILKRFVIKI